MGANTVAPHQRECTCCVVGGSDHFLLHYCEASHFDLQNYTFFEFFHRECEAPHSQKNVTCLNYPYVNSACVQFWQNY